ncbi:MAG: phosphoglycerate dehydrogenase [Prolixibacteraceae bacterium]|jgi:D-3-phosphoglycerate dehydrogenase|nr:phosphoglycerate dehydrogenase [Prolixibacteraceae bacterium]
MYKIQNLNEIDQEGLKLFSADQYEINSELTNPDAIILRSFKMHDMELPSSLKAIARAGAGVNNIPIDKCTNKGIVVFNTPGANANGVKELIIAGLMLSSRDISESIEWCKTLKDKGDEIPGLVEKGKKNFAGQEIKQKTLAVIGLGAIGVLAANAAQSLGMRVVGYDPYMSVKAALRLSRNVEIASSIENLFSQADYITINIPQTSETKGFINKERIALMKDNVRILNFARGGLINNADMKVALEEGKVARYVTDFPDAEIMAMKNVIAIPHLGASTSESETNCAVMAVDQLMEYIENGNIINSVNFPQASMERNDGARILICNKNIPNMVGQITTTLADADVNIANMLNRNREEIAYNIIDVYRKEVEVDIIQKLEAIDGIFMVRVIPA